MPLDIGVGLLLGVASRQFIELPYIACLLLGIAAALLPDLDYVWRMIKPNGKLDSTHRDILHYPLLLSPSAALIGYIISPGVALLFLVGTLLHFIHDSIGVGFGVKWLYPFNKNSYMFFFQASTPRNKNMPKRVIYSWDDDQRAEMIETYGYDKWIRHLYFRLHPYGLFEYGVLLTGILVAYSNWS